MYIGISYIALAVLCSELTYTTGNSEEKNSDYNMNAWLTNRWVSTSTINHKYLYTSFGLLGTRWTGSFSDFRNLEINSSGTLPNSEAVGPRKLSLTSHFLTSYCKSITIQPVINILGESSYTLKVKKILDSLMDYVGENLSSNYCYRQICQGSVSFQSDLAERIATDCQLRAYTLWPNKEECWTDIWLFSRNIGRKLYYY